MQPAMRGLEVTCRSFAGSTGADLSIIKPIKQIKFKGGDMTSNIFQDINDRVDLKDLVRFYFFFAEVEMSAFHGRGVR